MTIVAAVITFIVCFLIGSIPFGLVVSKYLYHMDLREHGSGNIGATNAVRVLGKKAGVIVFLLDALKGACASGLGFFVGIVLAVDAGSGAFAMQRAFMCLGFASVVFGHCFSPFLNWKGGKGIAAAGGGLFVVLGPLGGIVELATFGIVALATRYASVGSLVAAWLLVPLSFYKYIIAVPEGQTVAWLAFLLCLVAVLLVTWAHRENIKRLRAGTENRFGKKGE